MRFVYVPVAGISISVEGIKIPKSGLWANDRIPKLDKWALKSKNPVLRVIPENRIAKRGDVKPVAPVVKEKSAEVVAGVPNDPPVENHGQEPDLGDIDGVVLISQDVAKDMTYAALKVYAAQFNIAAASVKGLISKLTAAGKIK